MQVASRASGDKPAALRRRRQQPERQLQLALIDHLRWRVPPGTWWCHYPAGGWRTPVEAAILKSMGAQPGVPDVLIVSGGKLYAIELMSSRGRLSSAQVITHAAMREAGAVTGVANSIDTAIALLVQWKILRGAP